jgi:hypothetical protein
MAAAASLLSSSACAFFRRLLSSPHVSTSARFQVLEKFPLIGSRVLAGLLLVI